MSVEHTNPYSTTRKRVHVLNSPRFRSSTARPKSKVRNNLITFFTCSLMREVVLMVDLITSDRGRNRAELVKQVNLKLPEEVEEVARIVNLKVLRKVEVDRTANQRVEERDNQVSRKQENGTTSLKLVGLE